MSNNPYKYQGLKVSVPDSLLEQYGYPKKENCNGSQGGSWIVFDGCKTTDLESAFNDYLLDTPVPAYWNDKSHNMTQDEMMAVTRTKGANETLGFVPEN